MQRKWNSKRIFFLMGIFLLSSNFFIIWTCMRDDPCAIFGACLRNILNVDTNMVLMIKKPTNVLKKRCNHFDCIDSDNQKIIAVLANGDVVKVIDKLWGKDYSFYMVRLENGKIGYVESSNTFEEGYTRDKQGWGSGG